MSAFTDKLATYGVNLTITMERFAGDEALYEQCLYILLDDKNFPGLGQSIEAQNYEDAFAAAHALKGVVGNLGLTPMYSAICEIVESLRSNKYDTLHLQYDKIMKEYDIVKSLC